MSLLRRLFLQLVFGSILAVIPVVCLTTFPPLFGAEISPDPSKDAVAVRIQSLRAEIAYHDHLYFVENAPVISDYAYDQLKAELATLEARFPEVAATLPPPTASLGPTGTVPHRIPMLSLDKIYEPDAWESFRKRLAEASVDREVEVVMQPKFDGIAVDLRYLEGKLDQASTRGDGHHGQDITAHLRAIAPESEHLGGDGPFPTLVEIRGEVFASFETFAKLNDARKESGLEPFAHPRNFAGGALAGETLSPEAAHALDLVVYAIGTWEPQTTVPESETALHERFVAWGLPAIPVERHLPLSAATWDAIQAFGHDRREWPFPTDGVVVKANDRRLQTELGLGATAPRWAVAVKFAPPQAPTILRAVVPEIGRTGVLTPVAEFDPVVISGAEISRASLHHYDLVAALDLHLGDTIHVERAGEIIPQVVRADPTQRAPRAVAIAPPSVCPNCESATERRGVALYCPNAHCPGRLVRRLEHLASESALSIDGLGPETLEFLVRNGEIDSIDDLFELTEEDLRSSGIRNAEAIVASLTKSRGAPLWRVLIGLGIPEIGPARAKQLAATLPSLDALLDHEAWQEIEVPDVIRENVDTFLADPGYRATVAKLAELGIGTAKTTPIGDGLLSGTTFVFTGTLRAMTREEAISAVEALGGITRSSVSGATDYLVVGINPGKKLEEARARASVKVLDEAAFLALLESAEGDSSL